MLRSMLVVCLFIGALTVDDVFAFDWPQILGPNRNGEASEGEKLPKLDGKIVPAWEVECGEGYSGVAIASQLVIVFDRNGSKERVRALQIADGKEKWKAEFPTSYKGGVNADRGPRCVPVVVGDKVIVYGASGQLSCVSLQTGATLWSRGLRKEYGAEDGYFGAGSTPLVIGDRVIVNVGGRKEGGIVAVSLESGKTLWNITKADASYASPVALPQVGSNVAMVITRLVTYGVDCEKGTILWEFPFGVRSPSANGATPLILKNGDVLITASYGIGAALGTPTQQTFKFQFEGDVDLLSSQYCTPIEMGDFVFASDGREDMGGASLKCIDAKGRKALWETKGIEISHLITVDGLIVAVGIEGTIQVIRPNSEKMDLVSKASLGKGLFRALPAFSDGTLVVRDCDQNGKARIIAIR